MEQSLPDAHADPMLLSVQTFKTQILEPQSLPDAHADPIAPSVHTFAAQKFEPLQFESEVQLSPRLLVAVNPSGAL